MLLGIGIADLKASNASITIGLHTVRVNGALRLCITLLLNVRNEEKVFGNHPIIEVLGV